MSWFATATASAEGGPTGVAAVNPAASTPDAKRAHPADPSDDLRARVMTCLSSAQAELRKVEDRRAAKRLLQEEYARAMRHLSDAFDTKLKAAEKEEQDADKPYQTSRAQLGKCVPDVIDHFNRLLEQLKKGDFVWYRAHDPQTKAITWRRYEIVEIDAAGRRGCARATSAGGIPVGQPGHEITLDWTAGYTVEAPQSVVFYPSPSGDQADKDLVRTAIWATHWCVFDV
jgi:hypothetical protein